MATALGFPGLSLLALLSYALPPETPRLPSHVNILPLGVPCPVPPAGLQFTGVLPVHVGTPPPLPVPALTSPGVS